MIRSLNSIKPVILSIAIAAGIAAHCTAAKAQSTETAVVAGGCFWCVEADFEKVKGVKEVVSGFTGGTVANPSYRQVTRGKTGHVEAVEITYDPNQISYDQVLHMFLRSIDPLDNGGQFCDRGPTYAPAIFPTNAAQRKSAERALSQATSELGQKVKVPLRQSGAFYPADSYHQDYYKKSDLVITRFGPKSKAEAYKKYREACGRDARVKQVWGTAAPFVGS